MRGEGKMHQALEAKMAPAEACTNGKMPWAFDGSSKRPKEKRLGEKAAAKQEYKR